MGDYVLLSSDDQCLWKESDKILDFLFRNSYPGKLGSKNTTIGLD